MDFSSKTASLYVHLLETLLLSLLDPSTPITSNHINQGPIVQPNQRTTPPSHHILSQGSQNTMYNYVIQPLFNFTKFGLLLNINFPVYQGPLKIILTSFFKKYNCFFQYIHTYIRVGLYYEHTHKLFNMNFNISL